MCRCTSLVYMYWMYWYFGPIRLEFQHGLWKNRYPPKCVSQIQWFKTMWHHGRRYCHVICLSIFVLNALTGTCVEAWACKILICCRFRWHGCDFNPESCWRHQMETFSALLALCAGNSHVTREFTSQRAVTLSFDVFFDLRLNKRLSKQSRRRWFKTLSSSLWRHCNDVRSQPS